MMKTLLIADDENRICTLLSRFFGLRGFRTITANTGRETLDKLDAETPDYLLLDVKMPDMSGLDILRSVKARFPMLKVVMVTGLGDEAVVREAFKLGASDYIQKPFTLDEQAWARAFFAAD